MTGLRPGEGVPTEYGGRMMRSRLEARWAASLDLAGLVWSYEPEMFDLPTGVRYVPDFYLPEADTWIEVKAPPWDRAEKLLEFTAMLYAERCPNGRARGCEPLVLLATPWGIQALVNPFAARHPWQFQPSRLVCGTCPQCCQGTVGMCFLMNDEPQMECRSCGEIITAREWLTLV